MSDLEQLASQVRRRPPAARPWMDEGDAVFNGILMGAGFFCGSLLAGGAMFCLFRVALAVLTSR